jgi:hypothetical protein
MLRTLVKGYESAKGLAGGGVRRRREERCSIIKKSNFFKNI